MGPGAGEALQQVQAAVQLLYHVDHMIQQTGWYGYLETLAGPYRRTTEEAFGLLEQGPSIICRQLFSL